jgi:hypothetical protein
MFIRRLVLAFSIVLCGSLALAAAALAAGGGLPPGQTIFSETSANAFFGAGKGAPPNGFFVFVNQGLNSFEPENSTGTPSVTRNTMVQLQVFTASGGGAACYVIPDSDFAVSRNLQSASLHTTLTTANMCKGKGAPAIGKTGAAPLAANGVLPPSAGLPASIRVNVTWTGTGVTSTRRDRANFECLDYSSDSSLTLRAAASDAAGTISMLTDSFTSPAAAVGSSDGTIDVSGSLSPTCPLLLG